MRQVTKVPGVPEDDWRLRIELGSEGAHGLLGLLGLVDTDADELAHGLRDRRLVVTRDEDTVFVYATSHAHLAQPRPALEAKLAEPDLPPELIRREHWLAT